MITKTPAAIPFLVLMLLFSPIGAGLARAEKITVVLVFADDQGYQDLGVFGSPNI